ncbi:MAG: winged helix-turn-helix transcriptional regulator [Nitrospinae bacterium]|nr:winged helix-turn-helix transcriptional regulator [Nitrospinota bacterium]MZH41985.1 winged helix-turn-helix transcriptional regulator [Nitrospinota bacterium]MZH45775.1 winged helix-turn-helix transcriptional regulator [Nitrospinota bacterium]
MLFGLNLNGIQGAHILGAMDEQYTDSEECAKILKALGDETRLKIVQLLLKGEKSVSEIVRSLSMGQPQASHHLSILRASGLVGTRREGNKVINFIHPGKYFLNNKETGLDLGCCSVNFDNN